MTTKQLPISALTSFLILAPNTLLATDKEQTPLKSKLVSISSGATLENADKDLLMIPTKTGPSVKLTFLFKSKNIIQVVNDSVVTKDSKDWKLGSYPRIDRDGEAVAFVIEKKGDFLGKPNKAKVEGTVEILTGRKLIPKSFSLLAYDAPFQMDNFVFTLLEDSLRIEGDHKLVKKITAEHNGKTIVTRGSSSSGLAKTYKFKGIGKGAKISFTYWGELVTNKVHFSK